MITPTLQLLMPRKTPELALLFETPRGITAEQIYAEYPRKQYRPRALRAITIAMRKHPPEMLLELTRRFALAWRGDEDSPYIPHGASWFNGEGFLDDVKKWGPRRPYKQADKPLWARIDELRNAIACHKANPGYIRYERSKVADDDRADLKALRVKLEQLEAEQLRSI